MAHSATLGVNQVFKKRISVSQKRQITLPIEFFSTLGIGNEVDCYVQNNSIVIRPVHDGGGEFDEQILADLISEGLSGKELLSKFKEMRRQIRPAVKALIDDATAAANGEGDFGSYDDVFGIEDK